MQEKMEGEKGECWGEMGQPDGVTSDTLGGVGSNYTLELGCEFV